MDTTLDRSSPTPLYQQLAQRLRLDIREGRLPPGVAFPSERKLMRRYGVTRTTIRSAIAMLRQEGRVESEHGAGIFVRDPAGSRRQLRAAQLGVKQTGPVDPAAGPELGFRLSAWEETQPDLTPAPAWIAELLGVEEGRQLLTHEDPGSEPENLATIRRVWIDPESQERSAIASALAGQAPLTDLVLGEALVSEGEDYVQAQMPSTSLKERLGLTDGVPVIAVYRVIREQETAVAVIEHIVPGDKVTLVYPQVRPAR